MRGSTKTRRKKVHKGNLRSRWQRRGWLLLSALVAVGATFLIYEYIALPQVGKELVSQIPTQTALMEARSAEAKAAGRKPRKKQFPVGLSAISPSAIDAILISEDASFFKHEGIDTQELKKALYEAWEKQELGRGASTITQQLAKNLWLSTDRSLLRKAKEMILAHRLEESLSKKRILAIYVNVVEWGDGVYGIEAASREHFRTSAEGLSLAQGAILAAMLPAPRRWIPAKKPEALRRRALRIIDRLEEAGRVSRDASANGREEIEEAMENEHAPEAGPIVIDDGGDEETGF